MIYHPFRNLGLKFLSIGIALLLWLTVAGEPIVERSLRAPLELQNTPARVVLVESPPSQIDVRVRGASSVLSHLDAGDVVAVLDVDEAKPGSHVYQMEPAQVRVPFGVEVVQMFPVSISLRFEPAGSRMVPVMAVTEGAPAPGYRLGRIVVDPLQVQVAGPESSLKLLKQIATEPLSIEGAANPVTETVGISVADQRLRLVTSQTVRVTVEIKRATDERALTNLPVRLRNLSPTLQVRIVPAVAQVAVRGPSDVLSGLHAGSLVLYVDLAGLGPGRYNLPIHVEPPRDFEVVRTQPATVSVTIQ
jgi:YbbR domain-containing protein